MDDDIVEDDEAFYIDLTEARPQRGDDGGADGGISIKRAVVEVTILDSSAPGAFGFGRTQARVHASSGAVTLTVHRRNGCSGARSRSVVPLSAARRRTYMHHHADRAPPQRLLWYAFCCFALVARRRACTPRAAR